MDPSLTVFVSENKCNETAYRSLVLNLRLWWMVNKFGFVKHFRISEGTTTWNKWKVKNMLNSAQKPGGFFGCYLKYFASNLAVTSV